MRCPFCAHDDSQVKDSRPTEDSTSIRRRRQCSSCGARFTTFERVQLREVTVVKSGERRQPFERSKLEQSIALACRKRDVPQERIDQLVSGIQRQVETAGLTIPYYDYLLTRSTLTPATNKLTFTRTLGGANRICTKLIDCGKTPDSSSMASAGR
jgi:transcriptional repressor NrdR